VHRPTPTMMALNKSPKRVKLATCSSSASFELFQEDVAGILFSFVHPCEVLVNCMRVSKRWKALTCSDALWSRFCSSVFSLNAKITHPPLPPNSIVDGDDNDSLMEEKDTVGGGEVAPDASDEKVVVENNTGGGRFLEAWCAWYKLYRSIDLDPVKGAAPWEKAPRISRKVASTWALLKGWLKENVPDIAATLKNPAQEAEILEVESVTGPLPTLVKEIYQVFRGQVFPCTLYRIIDIIIIPYYQRRICGITYLPPKFMHNIFAGVLLW